MRNDSKLKFHKNLFSSKFAENYKSTEFPTLIVPCGNNLGTNGSSKSIRIEFMLMKRETIKNGTCRSFILCYESFLDAYANNGRIRPQFWIKNREKSNLREVCQPHQQERMNNWHGIGLRICAQNNQTSAYLRTSFSKSCDGAIVQNGNATTVSEGNGLKVFLEIGIGSSSTLPKAKLCVSENSKEKCAPNLDLDSPKDDLMSIKDGAMFQDLPNFWLLPLDIFLRNKNEINFQLVYNKELNVNINKDSANKTISIQNSINGRK